MFMFGLIAEVLREPIWSRLAHNANEASKPVTELGKRDGSGKTGMEAKNTNVENEAEQALYRQHLNVELMENIEFASRAIQKLKSCCKYINNTGTNQVGSEALRTAGQIILKRLEDTEVRLEGDRIYAQTTQALTQAHRQSVRDTIDSSLLPLTDSQRSSRSKTPLSTTNSTC
jgi:23S rRNA A2030 N6-methylase RlmJ